MLQPEKVTAIFPMRFKEDSDVVLATTFFQVGFYLENNEINIVKLC